MSVDYYTCKCCGESRYEEYVGSCSKCGKSIGTCCVVNDDIDSNYAYEYNVKFDGSKEQKEKYGIKSKEDSEYGYEIGDIIDDVGIDPKYCPFCNNKEIDNDDLLDYLLSKYNINKDDLVKEYIKSK